MKNIDLFLSIIDSVKEVEQCYLFCSYDDGDNPLCLIATAIRNGIDVPRKAAYIEEFSNLFDVSRSEAYSMLYLRNTEYYDFNGHVSGMSYFNTGVALLAQHGVAHA